uniref:Uncharacterized protein n=1 Tax=Romanomermis culicivorax TaxID=13658 RepID=A0A915ID58_ROMCU
MNLHNNGKKLKSNQWIMADMWPHSGAESAVWCPYSGAESAGFSRNPRSDNRLNDKLHNKFYSDGLSASPANGNGVGAATRDGV